MNPRILLLETSTLATVVAVATDDGGVESACDRSSQRHASGLVPAIEEVLAAAKIGVSDLDAVAVGVGPGSFTGLRVGLMSAKTICHLSGCRLIGLDSLWVVASAVRERGATVLAVADAQQANWYAARFNIDESGRAIATAAPAIRPRREVLGSLDGDLVLTGPGLARLSEEERVAHARFLAEKSLWNPTPDALYRCALDSWNRQAFADPFLLEPNYVRLSAAEERSR